MHTDPALPPLDGSLSSLPDYAEFQANNNGSFPWLIYSSSDLQTSKLISLSFTEVNDAGTRIAHLVRPDGVGAGGRVVAVVLSTDTVMYVAALLGICRAGLVPYPISPRNTPQAIAHMLKTSNCRTVLAQPSTTHLMNQVSEVLLSDDIGLETLALPPIDSLFPNLAHSGIDPVRPKPYCGSRYPVESDDVAMFIHSSGSTGFPKSIPLKACQVLHWMRHSIFGKARSAVRFGAMGLPTFHAMGFLLQICFPLCSGQAVVVHEPKDPAPPTIPHPENVLQACISASCNALIALPSYVEAWSHSQEAIDYLKTLRVLIFGGGPLSTAVGKRMVSAGVPLFCAYGGTEFGNTTQAWDAVPNSGLFNNPDWEWVRMAEVVTVHWEPQGDGSYELVIYENHDYALGVYNVEGEKAFATSDLFVPHPTKPGLWRIVGRKDDVITLSTGEKIVPLQQEGAVTASPLVSGCVMFGREHQQAGILVEPAPGHTVSPNDDAELADFRNKIWPVIEKSNTAAPAFARIFKEMILVADTTRPLPRSAKGAVIRNKALSLYREDVERIYKNVEESSEVKGIEPPANWTNEDIRPWLLRHVTGLLVTKDVSVDGDLFAQGFDSLSATFLRNRIIAALRSSDDANARKAASLVPSNFIFEHPSIQSLSQTVSTLVQSPTKHSQSKAKGVLAQDIRVMIERFAINLPSPRSGPFNVHDKPSVLLTGCTGNIGSHVLAQLLADERVGRVYALDRPAADPVGRLTAAFKLRKLQPETLQNADFVCLTGDVSEPQLGLTNEQYLEVVSGVTHIIHNAWNVNFNLPLQSFETQMTGVRKLVEICASNDRTIRLMVTSSIGVAGGWSTADGPVPEAPLPDPKVAASSGYSASKYVVEQILASASACGVQTLVVRMGQACGPRSTGAWGTTEWLPMMIKSSIALGCLPEMQGSVNWVPMDAIGQIYSDWVTTKGDLPLLVNVVHPHPTSWDVIYCGIRKELDLQLPIVSLGDWLAKLEAIAERATEHDMTRIPALKIMDFFRDLASPSGMASGNHVNDLTFNTEHFLESTSTGHKLPPISEEHAQMWVRYWKEVGFISP